MIFKEVCFVNELTLIKSAEFGEIQCDFYGDGKELSSPLERNSIF